MPWGGPLELESTKLLAAFLNKIDLLLIIRAPEVQISGIRCVIKLPESLYDHEVLPQLACIAALIEPVELRDHGISKTSIREISSDWEIG